MNTSDSGSVVGNIIDLQAREIFEGRVLWDEGKIIDIQCIGPENSNAKYLTPGFIDAHVHIESAMLPPSEFARLALHHGTVGAVTDPHEIANVMGMEGIQFMLADARQSPFHTFFGVPSCVPATPFETANGSIGCKEIRQLLKEPQICCLSEMMNYQGVLQRLPSEMKKIDTAKALGYPIDGHAPGLKGAEAKSYVEAGISTDHECFSMEEARDKIAAGMNVLIREGSAARNFETLHPLICESPTHVMFCSDDKHPDDLVKGHMNQMVVRAIAHGHSIFDVLTCACINPINHYSLSIGQLRIGDAMDAIEVTDLVDFTINRVWVSGSCALKQGQLQVSRKHVVPVNIFNAQSIVPADLVVDAEGKNIRVIQVHDGSLVTSEAQLKPTILNGVVQPDVQRDILLICVINRYEPTKPALGFIQGFGLTEGAIASSVAHDSHNVIAVGTNFQSICSAVNSIIEKSGGIAIANNKGINILPLPIAGLMSDQDGYEVAKHYGELDNQARAMGSSLRAPFMTLSFMALLVIPDLKLSDRGLFDGRSFEFTDLLV